MKLTYRRVPLLADHHGAFDKGGARVVDAVKHRLHANPLLALALSMLATGALCRNDSILLVESFCCVSSPSTSFD